MSMRMIAVFAALHIIVASIFLKGFLLTRIELPDTSSCGAAVCTGHAPTYSKAVVLIVDALRHDFVCDDGSTFASYRGSLPRTLDLVGASGGAAVSARFVADTPTITMSRLKALLTGGLPTFLDIGQSFSASALAEDNLLQQLLKQGKRLVAMGDDTWMQLARDAFTEAYPYPSFDVHDLHTVDDGVWEHLVPLLKRPDSWDVLIAHYLGVDHAGHTYGVNSRQMEAKLAQMDEQVSQVIELLASQAGPGGAYADTLLLVLSDHGQTLGGDHGGGTPAETDSVLIAISLRKMHAALYKHQQEVSAGTGNRSAAQLHGHQPHVQNTTAKAADSRLFQHYSQYCRAGNAQQSGWQVSAALERLMCSTGYLLPGDTCDSAVLPASDNLSDTVSNPIAIASSPGGGAQCWPWLCGTTMSQIDLTPLLAYLLGAPIPFGNLGKIPPHLFAALAAEVEAGASDGWLQEYAHALHLNSDQVHAYLNRYAVIGGLPAAQLSTVNKLYDQLPTLQVPCIASDGILDVSPTQQDCAAAAAATAAATEELIMAQLTFLSAAVDLARRRFTLFQQGPMWAGCALGVAVLALQLVCCWQAVSRLEPTDAAPAGHTSILLFAGLATFHALGLFSVGLLMGEGRLQCVLLAATTLLMLRAALTAFFRARALAQTFPGQQGHAASDSQMHTQASIRMTPDHLQRAAAAKQLLQLPWGRVLAAAAATAGMLACNAALQALGLIDRSGQDPHDKTQPSADLLVGPDAMRQRAVMLAYTLGPLLAVWLALSRFSVWLSETTRAPPPQTVVSPVLHLTGYSQHPELQIPGFLVKTLAAVQYISLGVFWVAQLTGVNDLTILHAGNTLWITLVQMVCSNAALQQGCGVLDVYVDKWLDLGNLYATLVAAVRGVPVMGTMLQLPLRLLLPRMVYVLTLVIVGVVLLCGFISGGTKKLYSALKFLTADGTDLEKPKGLDLTGHYHLLVWLSASLAASLIMVLGYKGPATMLLAVVQACCCCILLRMHAAASSECCWLSSGPQLQYRGADSAQRQQQPVSVQAVLGGGAWGMMALQLFFCSSHFCEFSGLQYASAFIGFDSMVWYTSGSLLLLNTCGFLLLGVLSLPVCLAGCTLQPSALDAPSMLRQLQCSMWIVNSTRFAAMVVCMVSAAVQQQHILLWAIFAPKLIFELCFMAVTDGGMLLTSLLTQLLL